MRGRTVRRVVVFVLAVLTAGAATFWLVGRLATEPRVVLYCAQDREFAEALLADFTKRAQFPVAPHYDTESDKSVSLYEELAREKDRPRCDVYWNNEILHTIRLQRQGLLEPYDSPSAAAYPASARAADHSWHAFAARARVLLVSTARLTPDNFPKSILDLAAPDSRWKGRVAMAKPLFGTTATQAACLFEALGPEAAKDFYRGLHRNEVQIVPGNKQAAEGVAEGKFDIGLTDTDDAIEEVAAGRQVAILFPDRDGHPKYPRLGTLFIPNTLAVVKGGPNPAGARKLVDYLLSEEVERKLAEGPSRQIPLNPNVKVMLPGIETPATVKPMAVDFEKAADRWAESQEFLASEFGW